MVRIEVLTVGRELLSGRTVNTNATWLGKRVTRMGTTISQITTVDDDLQEISKAVRSALERADYLVIVGGLGPTPDDMTLSGVAKALGRKVALDTKAVELMREHYRNRGMGDIELTPARNKMATIPRGAVPLRNGVGTAPGVRLAIRGTAIFSLPGVPVEMKSIFLESVEPELKARIGLLHRTKVTLKFEGIFESDLAPVISKELNEHPGSYIKSHPRGLKEGVSKIEMDIASVKELRRDSAVEADEIASHIISSVQVKGGKLTNRTRPSRTKED